MATARDRVGRRLPRPAPRTPLHTACAASCGPNQRRGFGQVEIAIRKPRVSLAAAPPSASTPKPKQAAQSASNSRTNTGIPTKASPWTNPPPSTATTSTPPSPGPPPPNPFVVSRVAVPGGPSRTTRPPITPSSSDSSLTGPPSSDSKSLLDPIPQSLLCVQAMRGASYGPEHPAGVTRSLSGCHMAGLALKASLRRSMLRAARARCMHRLRESGARHQGNA